MAKLEALLEQRGVASPREVSEAVARSQLHGGDVTTSLLQFSNIDEAALSAALSECYGLPAANVGALPIPEDAAAAPIPREVAERYCCFPLESGPGELVLAVARPLALLLKEELGFAFGVRLTERVALEVRIRQAISRCYGGPLSDPDQRAIERLDGNVDAERNQPEFGAWPDAQLAALPRPPSELPPPVAERADWPRPAPPQNSGPRVRRRGPFTLAMAREELARATSRNQVLDAFFSFACQFFEYSALFAVHNALAEGLNAAGPGAGSEEIQAVGVPLDLPSSLSEAAESCNVRITRLGRDGIDRTLAVDLRRQLTTRVLILPVCLRGRCAVLLYGDNGPSDVVEREVADVVALAPDVAAAIGRIILLRKRDAARQAPSDGAEWSDSIVPPRPVERESVPPDEAESSGSDFSIPTLPSKNRDRSRSNGRGRSSAPPAAAAQAHPRPLATHGDPIAPAAGEHLAEPPRAPSPAAATRGDDPVFPLTHADSLELPVPAAPVAPRRDVLHTAITRPARTVTHQPRLPSVIVDDSATEETAWTRAAAATQPPQHARKALLAPTAAAATEPLDAATLRPASKRQPAPAPRVEILPPAAPPDTALTDPAPPHPASSDTALTDPAPAPPALADPPTPAAPPPAAAAATPAATAAPPAAAAAAAPPATATATPPSPSAPRPSSPPPQLAAPSPSVSKPEATRAPEPDAGAPIKPFEQRPITGSARRSSTAPLPPFSKDRPSSPPLSKEDRPSSPPLSKEDRPSSPPLSKEDRPSSAPLSKEDRPSSPPLFKDRPSSPPFFKDRPSSPPQAPGAAAKGALGSSPPPARNIAIARPDSPSVRAVPRTPTARPPDPFARPAPTTANPRPLADGVASAEAPQPSGAEALPAAAPPATAAPTAAAPSASPPAAPTPPASVRPAPASQRPARDGVAPTSAAPTEPEIEALIEQLVQGNPRAVQDLTRIGAATVPQLMAHFPGPVVSERAGPSSRASECGPLLQTLASIGSPALPDITRSTEDHDARVRRWATLLLGEMPGPEACRAVVQRLADDVPRVHQAALDAARLLLSSSAANLFRKTLFEVAEAEDAPLTLRLRTLEHVARLRDSASVPRLIAFLALDTEPVVHKALWALTVITRQDFGRDAQSWGDWWQAHQAKHRFQWLIEALDHRDPRLRKAAADELLIEAKDSFGYAENLPEPERLQAQRRYQEWWENTGARRFGRLS